MLSVAIYILPTVLLGSLLIGFYLSRDYLFASAQNMKNKTVFIEGLETNIPPASTVQFTEETRGIDCRHLRAAIDSLTNYAKDIKPDWIVGIHPGGRLLSVIVAHNIGISPEKCLYLRISKSQNNSMEFVRQNHLVNSIAEGKVLFIDDISRSGDTLTHVKRRLQYENFSWHHTGEEVLSGPYTFRMRKAYFAVLLLVRNTEEVSGNGARGGSSFRPDWFYCTTPVNEFRLPWTELSHQISSAYSARRVNALTDEGDRAIEINDMIAVDFDEAFRLAREFCNLDALSPTDVAVNEPHSLTATSVKHAADSC